MKKNVIFLLIDSVYAGCIGNKKTMESSTPFIDTLINKSIFVENMFSYGPYTDAATKALYCANKTMDDLGYYYGINKSKNNHFQIFKREGYTTYGFYYPYYLLDDDIVSMIDYSIYTGGFKFSSVWHGKFEYFANIKKSRSLTDFEYEFQIDCLDMVFRCWFTFFKNIKNDYSSDIIKGMKKNDFIGNGYELLNNEYEQYLKGKRKYLDTLLKLGMAHPLAMINEYDYGNDKDYEFLKKVYKDNRRFFSKVNSINVRKNLKNNKPHFLNFFQNVKKYIKTKDKMDLRYLPNYGMLLFAERMMEKRSLKPQWQDICSLNKQIEVFENLLKKTKTDKPFYVSFHALEPHHNVSYFSYDCFNEKTICEELDYLKPLIDNCGKTFSGNLTYQLSLRYVDLCVKKLFSFLENEDLLKNTIVVLVSDHGTSYSFDPVRTRVVNTFHRENYNIPFLVWTNEDNTFKDSVNYYCSDNVFPTVCDACGILNSRFHEKSILYSEKKEKYVLTEYMGPGVPFVFGRDIWFSIRNNRFVVAYFANINFDFEDGKLVKIYDLQNDPNELKNVLQLKETMEIKQLLLIIKARFLKIKKDATNYKTKNGVKYEKIANDSVDQH